MTLGLLFLIFFKIGLFGFGGGVAMLPMIFQSLEKYDLMTASSFTDLVAISQVTPGPIIVNAATYIGTNFGGFQGACLATIGVSLPSFVIMLIAMHSIEKFRKNKLLNGLANGIKPATVGLIGAAVFYIAETVLFQLKPISVNPLPVIFCIATVIASVKFKINPIILIIIMGILGGLLCG